MTAQALAAAALVAAAAIIVALLVYRDRYDRRLSEAVERQSGRRHELELAERRRGRLEGELVIVNTPRPDDQTLKGVCRRELDGGGLVLEAAVYLERIPERGAETAREVPAGDVVIPAYSFAQIVHRTQEG